MLDFNEEFRAGVLKALADFVSTPSTRTADIVPSIPLLLAQLYAI
jgi:hypothetical protein